MHRALEHAAVKGNKWHIVADWTRCTSCGQTSGDKLAYTVCGAKRHLVLEGINKKRIFASGGKTTTLRNTLHFVNIFHY